MSAIAWWSIPAVSVLLALVWVAWTSRERPRADPQDTVESHRRFREAMARQPRLQAPRGDAQTEGSRRPPRGS